MQTSYSFQGVMTLTSPLHVADTMASHFDDQTKLFSDSGPYKNAKRTRYLTVMNQLDAGGRPIRLPYFPSNDFRGRLRRKAAWTLFDRFIENGQHIDLGTFHGMSCGSVTGRPASGSTFSLEEATAVRSDLWMALFGGGPRIYRSGLRTHDLLPVCEATINALLVPPVTPSLNSTTQMTYGISMVKKDDVFLLHDLRLDKLLIDYHDAVTSWAENVLTFREGKRQAVKRHNTIDEKPEKPLLPIDTIFATEVVAPGTPLYVRVDLAPYLTPAHVGLVAAALAELANENALGGLVSKGFGHFTWTLDLKQGEEVVAEDAIRFENGTWSPSNKMHSYMTELDQKLQEVVPSALSAFFNEQAA